MNQQQAIEILKTHQLKVTDKRLAIVDFFEAADGYRTPKALNAYMKSIYPNVSFDTVYRNLHLFHYMGLLESTTLNEEKHYRIKCSNQHHHHFICEACGSTKAFDMCPMNDISPVPPGYTVQDHKFEIYGLCPACQTG